MSSSALLKLHFKKSRQFAAKSIALIVGAHGAYILAITLLDQLQIHHGMRIITSLVIDLPLLFGLSLLYLASLLRRRKYTAWWVTIMAYVFYMGLNLGPLVNEMSSHHLTLQLVFRRILLPFSIVGLLLIFKKEFIVRSDRQGFRSAAKFSLIVLLAAMVYGTVGFSLFDNSDFHQEIKPLTAAHYTIDQFDLTTNKPARPYTKRAHIFVDSLSFISGAAVLYAVVAFFQPLRGRFSDQTANRNHLRELLQQYGGPSEDYFKLWPQDKQYYFDATAKSGLAYHIWRGVALCLGDPVGDKTRFNDLLNNFGDQCYENDWLPMFVHVQDKYRDLYEDRGYVLQKLGQEAVVDIDHFLNHVVANKYFRHIRNKFSKQEYTAELLLPPHHAAVMSRLKDISDDWLSRGGRDERGFAMGYFNEAYLQTCPIMVVRDGAHTIQAFVNQIPADFDNIEATYDLMRHTKNSMGNINDFLVMNFIEMLRAKGYRRLNMGLCPLTGLNETEDEKNGLIHNVLQFTYANGDRFYSFSGLHRFKSKYEPDWRDRFVAYQGGFRGFTRGMTALMRTMRIK